MEYLKVINNVVSSIMIVLVLLLGIETEFLTTSATCMVANGVCKTRCECKDGFTEINEFCLGKIDTQCSMTTECIPDAICSNISGIMYCACRDGFKAEFNNTECRLKVGSPCNVTAAQYCIQNAVCNVTFGSWNGSTCACKEGYSSSKNNTECLGNVGSNCTTKSECIQHAMCTGRMCTCEDSYTPSDDKTKCIGYVKAPCHKYSTSCVTNAACIQDQCKCNKGYHGDKICNIDGDKEDFALWKIIAIVVGSVVGVALCLLCWCCCRKCN